MRFTNILKWLSPGHRSALQAPNDYDHKAVESMPAIAPAPAAGNVVPFPGTVSPPNMNGEDLVVPSSDKRTKGILNTPELVAFFADSFYGHGRHGGSRSMSNDALTSGKAAIVSRFQNTLADLIGRRRAKVDLLELHSIRIEGVASTLTNEIALAGDHLRREITQLEEQVVMAGEQRGWVLDALNRFHQGFENGIRDALNFDSLRG
jgi:hypothetical protein